MRENLGKISAVLSDYNNEREDELVEIINQNISPPEIVTKDKVFIRAMYLVSDKINSYGGKFDYPELEKLAELIIGAPVMVGHRKDKLPIARIFHAETTEHENSQWLKCYFYWLKNSEKGEELNNNINGGIIKECSIGFVYSLAECSVCHKDIRLCSHEPFESYKESSGSVCFYYYRKIEQVLEASLVYRGAVKDTKITSAFSDEDKMIEIQSLSQLSDDICYLITPYYDGLELKIEKDNKLYSPDKNVIHPELLLTKTRNLLKPVNKHKVASLVGYRGKERCPKSELLKYLNEKPSKVTHLELKLHPDFNQINKSVKSQNNHVRTIPYAIGYIKDLADKIEKLKTKEGVCIYRIIENSISQQPILFKNIQPVSLDNISILDINDNNKSMLKISKSGINVSFVLRNFDLDKFKKGSRFLVEDFDIDDKDSINTELLFESGLDLSKSTGQSLFLRDYDKSLIIQKMSLNNKKGKMIYLKSVG